MELSYRQKGMKPTQYLTIIKIADVQDMGRFYLIISDDGERYSRFKDHNEWEQYLESGNNMAVFVKEIKRGERKYKNIYPDITKLKPIPDDEL